MPTGNLDPNVYRGRIVTLKAILWWVALFVATVNVLFVLRRAPILGNQNLNGDEAAAQAAARWLEQEPANARLLLLRPHSDFSVWFNYRLNYLTYPRRHDSAWDEMPSNAADRYGLVLAIGQTRNRVPANWITIRKFGALTLFSSMAQERDNASSVPGGPYHPTSLRIVSALFGIGVVLGLGYLLLGWTCKTPPFKYWWANIAVAHLVGATAMTWTVTILALVVHRLVIWPVYVLMIVLLPRLRRSKSMVLVPRDSTNNEFNEGELHCRLSSSRTRTLYIFFPIGVIALGIIGWLATAHFLGVGWDGYSIWQFKARAFLNDGNLSILRDSHYVEYAHLDYPLLVPLQTWWLGIHAGGYSELWSQVTGALFALDIAVLFAAFALQWVRSIQVLVGTAILVSLPTLTAHAVSGFADIEMACYLLTLGVFISRITVCGERNQFPIVLWLFAGTVLVKNEGMLAALSGLLVLLVAMHSKSLKRIAICALAAGVSYLPWLALKRDWDLKNDLLEGGKSPHFTWGLVLWRIGVAIKGFALCVAQTGPRVGGWGLSALLIPIGLVFTIYRRVVACYPIWMLCAAQTVGYVCIYVITPHAAQDHIIHSVDRLSLHLIPSMLLAALIGTFGERFEPTNVPE